MCLSQLIHHTSLTLVYYFLKQKGFTVLEGRKKWVLTRAAARWRASKTRLRKWWFYLPESKNIRVLPPWKYPWISNQDWTKFIELCTSDEFKVYIL